MEYFCYISQSKVDQLYANIEENQIIELSETRQSVKDSKFSGGLSNLLSLFKADISYGKNDMLVRNAKLKQTYVSKLKQIIEVISVNDFTIHSFQNRSLTNDPLFFYFEGKFKVTDIDHENLIVKILNEESNLSLNCSVKYFSSEPYGNDGKIRIDSANYAFFYDKIPMFFKTVFLLNGRSNNVFLGSPLFLALEGNLRIKNTTNNFIVNI